MKDLTDHGTRVWVLTCCYNRADIAQEALAQIYKTKKLGGAGWTHVFLNQHYPFDKKNNTKKIRDLCVKYGGLWMDAGKNLGLHDGLTYMFNNLPVKDTDYVIMIDLDNYPIQDGWDDALVRVLHYDKTLAQAHLWIPALHIDAAKHIKYEDKIVDGIRIKIPNCAFVKTVSAWPASFIKRVGGWTEPLRFWGHLEGAMHEATKRLGMKDCYLPDFIETSQPSGRIDPMYHQWKVDTAHLKTYDHNKDLEQYLRDKGKAHLIGAE